MPFPSVMIIASAATDGSPQPVRISGTAPTCHQLLPGRLPYRWLIGIFPMRDALPAGAVFHIG
jgi:hypothetical protein